MNISTSPILIGAAVAILVLISPNASNNVFGIAINDTNTNDTYPVYQVHRAGTVKVSDLPPIGDESNLNYSIPYCTDTCVVQNQSPPLPSPIYQATNNNGTLSLSDYIDSILGISSMTPFKTETAYATSNTIKSLPGGFDGLPELPSPAGWPAEPQVAVGPDYIMETININGAIWTKHGVVQNNNFTLFSFFNIPTSHHITDPKIFYDPISNRWFASIDDVTSDKIWFGLSRTSDPTYFWDFYFFPISGGCPDQPLIGTNDDKFAITANIYSSNCFGSYLYDSYFIVDKSQMLSHLSILSFNNFTTSNPSLYPVRSLSSTSNLYMVSAPFTANGQIQYYTVSNKVPLPSGSISNTAISIMTPPALQPPPPTCLTSSHCSN